MKEIPHPSSPETIGMPLSDAILFRDTPGRPGARDARVFPRCFDSSVLVRVTGDIVAPSAPHIVEKPQVDRIISARGEAIMTKAA